MTAPKLSIDDLRMAATLIKEGLTVEDVADKFDVTPNSLYNRFSEMGIGVRKLKQMLGDLHRMSLSELRMSGAEDIPQEPVVIVVANRPSHVLMPIDEYRSLKGV